MIKIYGMDTCPDCVYVEEQVKGDDRYQVIDIGRHVKDLKAFLRLRDHQPVFDAAKQADDIVLLIETDMDWEDIGAALRSRVRRSESIRSDTLIREGKDIRLSRADILQEGFKIRPADLT